MPKRIFGAVFVLSLLCALSLFHASRKTLGPPPSVWPRVAEELSRAWTTGRHPRTKSFSCPRLFFEWPPPEALKCNPLFIKCLFEAKPLEIRGVEVSLSLKQGPLPYKIVSKSRSSHLAPDYALEVQVGFQRQKRRLWLEDVCSSRYLPQRIYAYGEKRKNDFLWDNFGQHWFVDRRLATRREILEWLEQTGTSLKHPLDPRLKNHYKPATGLAPSEMRAYCQFRGKQLAPAHVLDAAFFLPNDIKNPFPPTVFRGPYPWTLLSKTGSGNLCQKIPAGQCQLGPFDLLTSSPTWIGVFQALGGPLEYVRNPRNPRQNVNISSRYFPPASPAHAIGKRGHWSGRGTDPLNFSLGLFSLPDVETVQVGFRCVKKRHGRERF